MSDRELLELAAKAAGEVTPSWYGNQAYLDGVLQRWNPLTDDGDALRLAAELRMSIDITDDATAAISRDQKVCVIDRCYRRAIVRAAAQIAKEQA